MDLCHVVAPFCLRVCTSDNEYLTSGTEWIRNQAFSHTGVNTASLLTYMHPPGYSGLIVNHGTYKKILWQFPFNVFSFQTSIGRNQKWEWGKVRGGWCKNTWKVNTKLSFSRNNKRTSQCATLILKYTNAKKETENMCIWFHTLYFSINWYYINVEH